MRDEDKNLENAATTENAPPSPDGAPPAEGAAPELSADAIDEIAQKRKKQITMIAVAVLLFVGVAGLGGLLLYKKRFAEEAVDGDPTKIQGPQKQMLFRQMDEIIVNLNTENRTTSFMKLKITLEIEGKNNLNAVNNMMPRIRDIFQTYLRELRPQDLQGSMGLYTLREELLLRINKVISPAQVNDILFDEVLIQ